MSALARTLLAPGGWIPTGVARELGGAARRTAALRLALAALLTALLAAAVVAAAGLRARPSTYFAAGGSGVVVVDLSTSVDPAKYRRLARVLRTLAERDQRVGLVAFSDTAYEMLPPGTRGGELRPLLRFFEPPRRDSDGARRTRGGFGFVESPWSGTFRGGTRISTGLRVARGMIERDAVSRPSVLLVSDLDDSPGDLPALTQEIVRYQRTGIRLRVVPLFPGDEDRRFFATLVGGEALLPNAELLRNTRLEERRTLVAAFPLAVVALAAALLLGLALNERVCRRLTWSRREAA